MSERTLSPRRGLRARLDAWKPYWPHIVLAIAFITTRIVYRSAYGIRFDASPFFHFIQFMDPWFVENDFVRSALYLTQQAPIPNFAVGGVYLLFGEYWWSVVFEGLFAGFGLLLAMGLLQVLLRVGIQRAFATLVVCFFISTPVAIVYENWLFYHVPVAALLVCSLLALLHFYRVGTLRAALGFFSLLALVALIRNVYGSVWLGAIVLALLLAPPLVAPTGSTARRTILKAAAIPLLLLMLNGARGKLLLGHDYGGAAVWTNVVAKTWGEIPPEEQKRLLSEGAVGSTVKHEPFVGVGSMRGLRIPHEPTGVPLLDMSVLPNGRGNTHTLEYLLIAEKYYKPDGRYLLKHYPEAYARSVEKALFDWYPSSPTRDIVLPQTANYVRVRKLNSRLNGLALGSKHGPLLTLQLLLPSALLYGVYRVLRPKARREAERGLVAMLLVMLLTIVYAALGTTMISAGDFSRYRFDVDPFYVILSCLLAQHLASVALRLARRLRTPRSPASSS